MIWYSLETFSAALLATCLIFHIIIGAECNSDYSSLYYTLVPVPNDVSIDETLVFEERSANAITACSLYCWKQASVSLYYKQSENKCCCNNAPDTRLNVDSPSENASNQVDVVYGYISTSVEVSSNSTDRRFDVQPYQDNCFALYQHGFRVDAIYSVKPIGENIQDIHCSMDRVLDDGADDCLQWFQYGYKVDGVYKILLSDGTSVSAWCDQQAGGWTVFQRRVDGSENFYRNWADYANGFGDISGEYWLGLEAIHLLTAKSSSLRIDLETFGDVTPTTAYALYADFSLHPASDKYRLSVSTYSGDCCDSFTYHNNNMFTTFDSDNDSNGSNCAVKFLGGWWYKTCHKSCLNGMYHGINSNIFGSGIDWDCCWGHSYCLKASTMKMRRNV